MFGALEEDDETDRAAAVDDGVVRCKTLTFTQQALCLDRLISAELQLAEERGPPDDERRVL